MTLIAKRYAKALFDATPADSREAVADDLAQIGKVLEDPAARVAVTDPDIPQAARQKACGALGAKAQPIVRNLINVLVARRREQVLLGLAPAYRELMLAARGEVEGILETAGPLDAETVAALEKTATSLSGQKVILQVRENPDLIGGVRMRVGNTLFDSSVASAIEELERQLLNTAI